MAKFLLIFAAALCTAYAGIINTDVGPLISNQNQLVSNIQTLQSGIQQISNNIAQSSQQWGPRPELVNGLQSSLNIAIQTINDANSRAAASAKLLNAIQSYGGGANPNWVNLVIKLQNLSNQQISIAQNNINSLSNLVNEVTVYINTYNDAKANQLVQSKAQMDQNLQSILQQTLQSGQRANQLLTSSINEWSNLVQTYAGPRANEAIQKLRVVTEQTLFDLAQLHPEDIEQSTSDAHRTIEDVKHILYEYGVPPVQVRNAVNNVQSNMFQILNQARAVQNDALHASIISKRRR